MNEELQFSAEKELIESLENLINGFDLEVYKKAPCIFTNEAKPIGKIDFIENRVASIFIADKWTKLALLNKELKFAIGYTKQPNILLTVYIVPNL